MKKLFLVVVGLFLANQFAFGQNFSRESVKLLEKKFSCADYESSVLEVKNFKIDELVISIDHHIQQSASKEKISGKEIPFWGLFIISFSENGILKAEMGLDYSLDPDIHCDWFVFDHKGFDTFLENEKGILFLKKKYRQQILNAIEKIIEEEAAKK